MKYVKRCLLKQIVAVDLWFSQNCGFGEEYFISAIKSGNRWEGIGFTREKCKRYRSVCFEVLNEIFPKAPEKGNYDYIGKIQA
jgi:hypothetical protein